MVLLLPRDVVLHGSRSGAAYGERGVSGLPGEPSLGWELLVHPARRIGFHHSQQLCHRLISRNRHEQMHVIRRTVDDQWNTISLFDNATHVREEAADNRGRQGRRTILGREDEVNQKGSEGVRHKTYAPFRGSLLLRFDSTRLTPWATVFRPPGLPREPAQKEVRHRAENSRLKCSCGPRFGGSGEP